MSLPQRVCITLGILGLAFALPTLVSGQATYVPQAGEYFIAGNQPGDQTYPQISLNQTGGFMVWQDNITDGDGLGISAVQLDGSFSPEYGNFRVNQIGAGDQQNPQVALLAGGGAIFVWQGGVSGQQHIYARFLSSGNTWLAGDEMVNTATNFYQINPVVCVLTNGNIVVAWSSWNQDGSMQGVYAQLLSPAGQKIGGEISINQFTQYNQKSPAIAALAGGGFVITWASEQERLSAPSAGSSGVTAQYPAVTTAVSVDIYARIYNSSAAPAGNEFLVNTGTNLCANPSAAGASDGSFTIAWSQFDLSSPQYNSWDVYLRSFSSAGVGGNAGLVNTTLYGDQYVPKVAVLGTDYMVVWTSLGQDGSLQGVFGQFCYHDGSHNGGEFQVNTTTLNQQEYPAVASDGVGRFLAVWSSFSGPTYGMDLEAQRYANNQEALIAPTPDAPFVMPLGPNSLQITWAPPAGYNVSNYDLYINGSVTPTVVTSNYWVMTGLGPNSTNCFSLDCVLATGQRSAQSAVACGGTWGADNNYDGLPDDWQALYWGTNPANWPPANKRLAPGGPTVLQAFLAGSNPLDPNTWLMAKTIATPEGVLLEWNSVPGCIYQVLTATNLPPVWTNLGLPLFANTTNDWINLGVNSPGYYKISRLR